jgi:hypothetical protein
MKTNHITVQPRLFIVGAIAFIVLNMGCAKFVSGPSSPPLPTTSATELLVSREAFPRDWMVDPCNPDRCLRDTNALRTFGRPGIPGSVIQQIFRLGSVEAAKDKFSTYREVDFRPRQSPNIQLAPPSEITYHSPIADEFYFGCGVDEIPACEAIFRYNNYFVFFHFDIDSGKGDGLKIEQVEPILRAMDSKAASVLGIPLPTRTP